MSLQVFRGFIPASAIRTSKGFVGVSLDSLWARHIFDSFAKDDDELVTHALKSCIADIGAVVEGGEFGCAFYIGNYGFYARCQFAKQAEVLQQHERILIEESKVEHFSYNEWIQADSRFVDLAEYGRARIDKACKGDTFLMLALRASAFDAAQVILKSGTESLALNEDNEDAIEIVRQVYGTISDQLVDVNSRKVDMAKETIIPSHLDNLLSKDNEIMMKAQKMINFLRCLQANINQRLCDVEKAKWTKKKADLKREVQ
jgi:hypothetical protein